MADRSNFWKMVDRTKPSKIRVFADTELRDCEDYFLEIESDSMLPPNEIITASERLALIRSELALRHSDAKHRQTQRLARWAIAFGMVSVAVAITSGVMQFLAHKPTPETWPATIEAPIVATPPPVELPSATPERTAGSLTATPEFTAAASATATPQFTATPAPGRMPTERPRKKRRTRPETTKKTDPVSELLRSLFPPRPTPRDGSRKQR
jgi:hypothetical protein